MLLSCKITCSILSYLERKGIDLGPVYEQSETPREFLFDSSYWLTASDMEKHLELLSREYGKQSSDDFIVSSGHTISELRTWGALDSVLRMVKEPQDVLAQPDRFLSYFISPAPPVAGLSKTDSDIRFEIPIDPSQYPLCFRFLTSAIEALPSFQNKEFFTVQWEDSQIRISWDQSQETLLDDEEQTARNIRPELYQNVLKDLEENQKKLEAFQKEILEKDKIIAGLKLQQGSTLTAQSESSGLSGVNRPDFILPLQETLSDVFRMNDYLARAVQLVTILVGQGRGDRQVQEAMRRVDWERIRREYPEVIEGASKKLKEMHRQIEEEAEDAPQSERQESSLTELLDQALDSVDLEKPESIKVDRHFIFDHTVRVDRDRMRQALIYIISSALKGIDNSHGALRIVTRPKGTRAEIEISDTGKGYSPEQLKKILTDSQSNSPLRKARTILQTHQGDLSIKSEVGRGSTFTLEIPV